MYIITGLTRIAYKKVARAWLSAILVHLGFQLVLRGFDPGPLWRLPSPDTRFAPRYCISKSANYP